MEHFFQLGSNAIKIRRLTMTDSMLQLLTLADGIIKELLSTSKKKKRQIIAVASAREKQFSSGWPFTAMRRSESARLTCPHMGRRS